MDKPPPGGIRRVVARQNEAGLAVVEHDDECELLDVTKEHATFAVVWSSESAPADNADPRDGAKQPVWSGQLHNPDGSVLRFVDFPPHCKSPMHKTQSLDYGIVMWGEIELHLDGGDKRTLKQSEVIVQRGTNHLWANTTDKWTRVAFILLGAKPLPS